MDPRRGTTKAAFFLGGRLATGGVVFRGFGGDDTGVSVPIKPDASGGHWASSSSLSPKPLFASKADFMAAS